MMIQLNDIENGEFWHGNGGKQSKNGMRLQQSITDFGQEFEKKRNDLQTL